MKKKFVICTLGYEIKNYSYQSKSMFLVGGNSGDQTQSLECAGK